MRPGTYHHLLRESLVSRNNTVHGHAEIKVLPHRFMPDEAEKIAKGFQEADPAWAYKVAVPPEYFGYAVIEAFDEKGEFVGRF